MLTAFNYAYLFFTIDFEKIFCYNFYIAFLEEIMKRLSFILAIILSFSLMLSGCQNSVSITDCGLSTIDFVKQIKVGWSLGNTFDATGADYEEGATIEDFEKSWGNPLTTEDMILKLKEAGFNAVRVPVSWHQHLGDAPNYTIKKDWLDRVETVVNYAYKNDMFVILNMHHEDTWLIPDGEHTEQNIEELTAIWKQLCARFKNYNQNLIFEGFNEPRTVGSQREWMGGTEEERKVINQYNAEFVKTVRSSGGYNEIRYLMIPTYGANFKQAAITELEIPDDDRVIASVHAYIPEGVSVNGKTFEEVSKKSINNLCDSLKETFLDKGVAVIIGEMGSTNSAMPEERAECFEYYISTAKSYGIPCFIWDNGKDYSILDRNKLEWRFDVITEAIKNAIK